MIIISIFITKMIVYDRCSIIHDKICTFLRFIIMCFGIGFGIIINIIMSPFLVIIFPFFVIITIIIIIFGKLKS
jgi:hypothetical protein